MLGSLTYPNRPRTALGLGGSSQEGMVNQKIFSFLRLESDRKRFISWALAKNFVGILLALDTANTATISHQSFTERALHSQLLSPVSIQPRLVAAPGAPHIHHRQTAKTRESNIVSLETKARAYIINVACVSASQRVIFPNDFRRVPVKHLKMQIESTNRDWIQDRDRDSINPSTRSLRLAGPFGFFGMLADV